MIRYVVITAGGTGTRMGSDIPKQFIELNEKPVLMHTIECFFHFDNKIRIIISLPEEHIEHWKDLCIKHGFNVKHEFVAGGKTRFHSIKNALNKVSEPGLVAVHDGVRPLVSIETIRNTFQTTAEKGNAVASRDIVFSLRKVENEHNYHVERSQYKEIQTPQTFQAALIKKAYEQAYEESFTDDASVIEKFGEKIFLVDGNPENIKITTQADLVMAEVLLNRVF